MALDGDLGVGKTTLVQGIARGLEILGPITSPTFTLIKEYTGRLSLYHVDVYRLEDPEEITELGFDELLAGDGVVVVEWAHQIKEWLPKDYLHIVLTRHVNIRMAEIEAVGSGYQGLIEELMAFAGAGIG